MAGYIGSKAVSVNTTSATISDDLAVGDDLTVTDDATIGGTLGVTGVLTTTAATVFNGGFAANDSCTITKAGDPNVVIRNTAGGSGDPVSLTLRRRAEDDAYTDWTFTNSSGKLSIIGDDTTNANNPAMTINYDGFVTFNEGGLDADFRVESDDETHAIFVNGGDDVVSFFTTTTVNAASGVVGPDGVSHYADGRTDISRASGQPLNLRRRTDDGIIANFYKEASGTTTNVGSIGTLGSRMSIGTGDVGLFFNDQTDQIQPINTTTNAPRDNAITLGAIDRRFKDLYLSGNVVVASGQGISFAATGEGAGSSGTSELLDDYEEGTWTPTLPQGGTVGTVHFAKYTKIGNSVTARLYFNFTATNNTTLFQVGGLPYSVSANHFGGGNIGYTPGVDTSEWSAPLTTSSHIYFYNANATNNLITNNVWGGVERSIILEVFYQTG